MVRYIMRRMLVGIFMLIGSGVVWFIGIKLAPGDFATTYEGYLLANGATQADADRQANYVRVQYGLDKPVPVQFMAWAKGIVTEGKFGYSFAYGKDVGQLIADRIPMTGLHAFMCHAISTFLCLGLVTFIAPRQDGLW